MRFLSIILLYGLLLCPGVLAADSNEIEVVQFAFLNLDSDKPMEAWAKELNQPVSNRIEQLYDEDLNGSLQNLEVLYFLRDVVNAVKDKGRFGVVSNILKPYDEDQDGRISRNEAAKIEAYLY